MALPVVLVLCIVALGFGAVIYMCLRRSSEVVTRHSKEVRFDTNVLPGEPRDPLYRVTYVLLNAANCDPGVMEFPSYDDLDYEECLQTYREANHGKPLTIRGLSQVKRARLTRYDRYLRSTVCCFAANTVRAMETAKELVLGPAGVAGDGKTDKLTLCNKVWPLDCMSQYGTRREGRFVAPRHYDLIEEAVHHIGTAECDLNTLYEVRSVRAGEQSVRSAVGAYCRQAVFALQQKLATEAKQSLRIPTAGESTLREEDVIVIVGQTPYINALAVKLAELFGHPLAKRKEFEEVNLAELDGFVVSRDKKTTRSFTFELEETAQTPFE